ncbi:tail tape measure protein [Pseudoalteromonas phage J2-1_QLiu-2017]|nr:tail tape measure protein [Pseudoalteromonas phage J2-1_QLiu-2017]
MAKGSNNVIEEFFIAIGLDTSAAMGAKKELDKIFGVLDRAAKKNNTALVKQQEKLQEKLTALEEKNAKLRAEAKEQREKASAKLTEQRETAKAKMAEMRENASEKLSTAKANAKEKLEEEKAKNKKKRQEDLAKHDEKIKKVEDKAQAKIDKAQEQRDKAKDDAKKARASARSKRMKKEYADRQKRMKEEQKKLERIEDARFRAKSLLAYDEISRNKRTGTGAKYERQADIDKDLNKIIRNADGTINLRATQQHIATVRKDLKFSNQTLKRMNKNVKPLYKSFLGMEMSSKNLLKSLTSVYAVLGSIYYIKEAGMQMESLGAAMTAVAGNSNLAKEEMQFLREESMRLGFDMAKAGKSYMKLMSAATGKVSKSEIRDTFVALQETATVLGLTQDESDGATKAIVQMFSKGQIMAEELKGQLAERMPIAMRALERSTGKTAAELFKMMEAGKLGADAIMPMVKEMQKLATQGGALDKMLNSVRTAENRMINQTKLASNTIFENGFGEGLANLYNTITKQLQMSEAQLEKLGRGFGHFFDAIAKGIDIVAPILRKFIDYFEWIAGSYVAAKLLRFSRVFIAAFRAILSPVMAVIFAVEELISLFSDDIVGGIERMAGRQFNIWDNTTTKLKQDKDGNYIENLDPRDKESMTGWIGKGVTPDWFDNILDWNSEMSKTSYMTPSASMGTMVKQNITVNAEVPDARAMMDLTDNLAQEGARRG